MLQVKTGSFEGTSGSATLDVAPTAGNTIVIAVGIAGDGVGTFAVTKPTGFEKAVTNAGGIKRGIPYTYMKASASGSESSWTLNVTGGSQQVVWAAFEFEAVDMFDFLGVDFNDGVYLDNGFVPISDSAVVASRATDASPTSESYNALAFAVFVATSVDTTIPVISGYNGNWQEVASVSRTNATRAIALTVVFLPLINVETFQCTASVSPSSYFYVVSGAVTAIAARHAANFESCFGAEIGTATSITNTSIASIAGPAPLDTVVGSPAIVTTTPRTGAYCLELSSVAAAECVTWNSFNSPARGNLNMTTSPAPPVWVERFHFYCPTVLPVADVEIASIEAGSLANGVVIWYRSASQKIGVKIGTGTEVLSDAVIVADQWIGMDIGYDPRKTTHICDWQVDYNANIGDTTPGIPQTQATTSSMTAALISIARLGWTTAKTATIRYDDWAGSRDRKTYPIGDINIRPLKVDPAGTPTVSGSEANFKVFTSNGGTLSTWSAAGTRTALDDVPPTIGASSDGVTQVASASSEYVEIPMETFTSAPDHVAKGLRWYAALWASSGTSATLGMRFWDGVSEQGAIPAADHGFDNTTLMWITRMHTEVGGDKLIQMTQDKVDALAARVGFSSDAAPDTGIHCVLAELVTQPVVVYGTIEGESGAFSVYVHQDPLSGAVAGYTVTTPSGTRGATLFTTIETVDAEDYVAPNTIWTKVIGADDVTKVTSVGLTPDPAE